MILAGNGIEFTQQVHAGLHFVALYSLRDQQLDALLVIVAQHLHEVFRLVVLAAEAQHQHGTSIGVQADVAQHLARVLVVVRQLRASVVVVPGIDGIDGAVVSNFLSQLVGQSFGNAVDAAYRRYNPYFVTYAYITVLADVAPEGSVLDGNVKLLAHRLVRVLQRTAEVCLQVVFVHPVAGFHVLAGMADRVAVLDDVFAFAYIFY